jgi:hypothetical protein
MLLDSVCHYSNILVAGKQIEFERRVVQQAKMDMPQKMPIQLCLSAL